MISLGRAVISDKKSSWPPGQRGSDWQEDGSDFMPHIPVLNEAGGGGRGGGYNLSCLNG
jgi:hypothetical protein